MIADNPHCDESCDNNDCAACYLAAVLDDADHGGQRRFPAVEVSSGMHEVDDHSEHSDHTHRSGDGQCAEATSIIGCSPRHRERRHDHESVQHEDDELAEIHSTEPERIARAFRVVGYPTPPGCAAVYYPEANVLTQIGDRSTAAGTPSFKSIPVTLRAIPLEPPRPPLNGTCLAL